jgi:predicted nucleotidyltransferase component of viral defense system
MLSIPVITHWGTTHPWSSAHQIEQDLLLSRAICAIADHEYLGRELIFRGGTALHKLHLPRPLRYSEDLDYVRSTGGGIGRLTGAMLDLGRSLEFDVGSRMGQHPKVLWRTTSSDGTPVRIKLEINTHERSPALPIQKHTFRVDSPWWSGSTQVCTFQLPELIATKIRALYQRSKGRDLFDMWLALTCTDLDADSVVAAFAPYRPDSYTAKLAIANLEAKLADDEFRHDIDELVARPPEPYDIQTAAALVIDQILSRV